MAERDSKGRFIKGNKEGRKFTSGGQQAEVAAKAGRASAEAKRERKTFTQYLEQFMDREVTNQSGDTLPVKAVSALEVANRAMKGDYKALSLYLQLTGELVSLSKTEVTGKDGKDLIPDNKEELLKELERLKEATR